MIGIAAKSQDKTNVAQEAGKKRHSVTVEIRRCFFRLELLVLAATELPESAAPTPEHSTTASGDSDDVASSSVDSLRFSIIKSALKIWFTRRRFRIKPD